MNQLRRATVWTTMIGALSVVLGCGDGAGTDGGTKGVSSGGKQYLDMGTAPVGGAFNPVGQALSEVLNAHHGTIDWTMTAKATQGTRQNIRDLASGKLHLGLANAAISYFAVRGESDFKQKYEIRSVMTLAPNIAMFITPADSGIKQIADLKNNRVVIGPAGAGFEMFVGPLLAAHGVTFADFTPINATQSSAADHLKDGNAAAAFLGGAVHPSTAITQILSDQKIFFVPFDEAARAKLIEEYPFFHPATIPADAYTGYPEFKGLNVGSMHLITYESASDDLIYNVTKSLYEHRDEVLKRTPVGRAINPENVVRNTGTPFHPGAIKYYKEIDIWRESTGSSVAKEAAAATNSTDVEPAPTEKKE